MFDNNSNIFCFAYEVQLDNIVKIICDISYDIGKQIEQIVVNLKDEQKGFTIEDLFLDSFIRELPIRPEDLADKMLPNGEMEKKGYTNDEFFSIIANYYNNNLFKTSIFLDNLINSDILLIDKQHFSFLTNNEKSNDSLMHALKKTTILKQIISNLKCDKIQNSLNKIEPFENDIFYRNAISSSKLEGQPLLPFLPISFLNDSKIEKEETDIDNFWINFKIYKEKYKVDLA